MKKDLIYTTFSTLAQFGAAFVGGQVIYQILIVPNLRNVKAVPLTWWLGASSIILIVSGTTGWYSKTTKRVFLSSFGGAIGICTYLYWASVTSQPAFRNQPYATIDPIGFWAIGIVTVAMILIVISYIFAEVRRALSLLEETNRNELEKKK